MTSPLTGSYLIWSPLRFCALMALTELSSCLASQIVILACNFQSLLHVDLHLSDKRSTGKIHTTPITRHRRQERSSQWCSRSASGTKNNVDEEENVDIKHEERVSSSLFDNTQCGVGAMGLCVEERACEGCVGRCASTFGERWAGVCAQISSTPRSLLLMRK